MADLYRFVSDVKVDGVPYKAGDVASAADIPAGCLESCLFTKKVVAHREPELPVGLKELPEGEADLDPAAEPEVAAAVAESERPKGRRR